MRNELNVRIEKYRDNDNAVGKSPVGVNWGCFTIIRLCVILRVMSSGADRASGWEHVSVSLKDRCPTWDEMCFIKNLFWHESETVIQFHPKKSKHINQMPYCLHLWKQIGGEYVLPPDICV